MKWHRLDPVSRKEIDRNTGMQQVQSNRNPFIDYPILAEFLWGIKAGEVFSFDNAVASFDPEFIPGQSDGWREPQAIDNVDVVPVARKLLINGQLYLMVGEQMYNLQGQRVK